MTTRKAKKPSYAFEATRKKETKHKVVFEEVEKPNGDNIAVGGLYVSKWLINDFAKDNGAVNKIKVTIEAVS